MTGYLIWKVVGTHAQSAIPVQLEIADGNIPKVCPALRPQEPAMACHDVRSLALAEADPSTKR